MTENASSNAFIFLVIECWPALGVNCYARVMEVRPGVKSVSLSNLLTRYTIQ
jgi:hypothetical protein